MKGRGENVIEKYKLKLKGLKEYKKGYKNKVRRMCGE
jgi:hypothetical protein